jgi:outer membrane protein
MKKLYLAFLLSITAAQASATQPTTGIAILSFTNCITESKLAKKEQEALNALIKQYTPLLEDSEKQIKELREKIQDKDFMNSLAPEAETALKEQWFQLNDTLNRQRNEFDFILQQNKGLAMQTIAKSAQEASKQVAQEKNIVLVLGKDACFFSAAELDITEEVIKKMDAAFEESNKTSKEAPQP